RPPDWLARARGFSCVPMPPDPLALVPAPLMVEALVRVTPPPRAWMPLMVPPPWVKVLPFRNRLLLTWMVLLAATVMPPALAFVTRSPLPLLTVSVPLVAADRFRLSMVGPPLLTAMLTVAGWLMVTANSVPPPLFGTPLDQVASNHSPVAEPVQEVETTVWAAAGPARATARKIERCTVRKLRCVLMVNCFRWNNAFKSQ